MTNPVTREQLENANLDCATLESVVNDDATPGTVTSRLGTPLKTLAKVIDDLATQDIGSSAAALINARLDDIDDHQIEQDNLISDLQFQINIVKGAIGFDSDALAFAGAAGITDPVKKLAISDFVRGLKFFDLWNRAVAIYPFIGGTAASHKYNLKNPADSNSAYRIGWNGGVTHDSSGVTGNGSTGYGNTNIDLNKDFPQYSLEMSVYVNQTTHPGADDYFVMGTASLSFDFYSNDKLYFAPRQVKYSDGTTAVTLSLTSGVGNPKGLWTCIARHYDELRIYKNGISQVDSTESRSGYWPGIDPNTPKPLWILGNNNNNTLNFPCPMTLSYAAVGSAMSQAEMLNYNVLVQKLQLDLGR